MMRGSRMLRRALILGGLCVVVAAVASVGWAMSSATNDKLVACAKKKGGALRLVEAAKNCRKTERVVTWNQEGPRGLPGQKGAGEAGADGLDGEDGVDGDDGDDGVDGIDGDDGAPGPATKFLYVFSPTPATIPSLTTTDVASAACPGGYLAVNAGAKITGTATPFNSSVHVVATAPTGTVPTASSWLVRINNTDNAPHDVTLWVLCSNGVAGP